MFPEKHKACWPVLVALAWFSLSPQATVLEEMPPFPERESSILAKLKKKKGSSKLPDMDDSRKNVNGSSEHAEDAEVASKVASRLNQKNVDASSESTGCLSCPPPGFPPFSVFSVSTFPLFCSSPLLFSASASSVSVGRAHFHRQTPPLF